MDRNNEIEQWYEKEDPWQYQTTEDDQVRKEIILTSLPDFEYKRALDIGCGEGWITKDLPAKNIFGIEMSNNATQRFPKNVNSIDKPEGKYDLIIATGVLYGHYDYKTIYKWIQESASKIVLVSGIKEWEIDLPPFGKQIYETAFPYRGMTQHLTIYDVSLS